MEKKTAKKAEKTAKKEPKKSASADAEPKKAAPKKAKKADAAEGAEAAPKKAKAKKEADPAVPKVSKKEKAAKAALDKVTAEDAKRWAEMKSKHGDDKAANYTMTGTFEANKPLSHKILGWGYIVSINNDRLEVLFESGTKTLISNYKTS